ncbi:MAG TPA: glycosyltransferase family A protein, partial [Saprospiraceae bacterium]|nr:glycosyltransferase family A protein [Saprospiraceae bacterium]
MRAQRYFQKHGIFDPFIIQEPGRDLEIVVVIPAYREDRLFEALQSLMRCDPATGKVEILVVLNYPESERAEMEAFHRRQYERLIAMQESLPGSAIQIQAIPPLVLEDRHAGVGLARKAGMDEAVRRFEALGQDGIILNFDADCVCDPSYLRSVQDYFHQHPDRQAVSIGFRHLLQHLDDAHVRAIQL